MTVTMVAPGGVAAAGGNIFLPDGTEVTVDANGRAVIPVQFVSEMVDGGWMPVAAPLIQQESIAAVTTVGAATLTAANIAAGVIARSGSTADFTDTTDTGTAIVAALSGAVTGQSFEFTIDNNTAFVETLAAGVGVTLAGLTKVPGNTWLRCLLRVTAPTTVTITGIAAGKNVSLHKNLYATDAGSTTTLAAAKVAGADNVVLRSSGGTAPTLTMPAGTDLIAAMPNWQIGSTYRLRVINNNSGQLTLANSTGVTLTGTLTLAQNTWRDFIMTMATATTVTGQAVGTGTDS